MYDALTVNVAYTEAELTKHPPRLMFAQSALLYEVVEELSACTQLGD